jgi:hypothetical protein
MITTKSAPLALLVVLTCASQSMLRAGTCVNDADCILAGFDYFVTTAGTFFTIAGVPVPLMGIPDPAHFGADTIVQRLMNIDVADVINSTQTVNTQMTELALTGVDPNCPQPGIGACNVFIHLDPAHPTLGNLIFTQTVNGEGVPEGTFTSFFDVFFDLSFTTLGGAPLPCDVNGNTTCLQPDLTLTGSGSWTDDNGGAFIVGGTVQESHPSPPGVHDAQQIQPTPEPVSAALLGVGLAGLLALARRRQLTFQRNGTSPVTIS